MRTTMKGNITMVNVKYVKNQEYKIPHLEGKGKFKKVYKNFYKTYYKTEDFYGFEMTTGKYKGTQIKISKDLIGEVA